MASQSPGIQLRREKNRSGPAHAGAERRIIPCKFSQRCSAEATLRRQSFFHSGWISQDRFKLRRSATSGCRKPARRGHRAGKIGDLRGNPVGRACPRKPMQLGGKWLRSRFLRQTRSEARADPSSICKRRTTKSLRKKIEPTRPIRLHGYGLGVGGSPDPAFFELFNRRLTEDVALTELKSPSRRIFSFKYAVVRD